MQPSATCQFIALSGLLGVFGACGTGASIPRGEPVVNVGEPPWLLNVVDHDPEIREAVLATVADNPNNPTGPQGALDWLPAATMTGVRVAVDRDSAVITVPTVAGAFDFRVFALVDGIAAEVSAGGQRVANTDIFCAGHRQFNDRAPAAPVVMQQIEVFGLTGPTRLVVEALDRTCPFVGLRGGRHFETQAAHVELPPADKVPVAVFTEEELRQAYDNTVVFNGHAPGPRLAAPAPNTLPRVLARTTVVVNPVGNGLAEVAYFDDFSDSTDQPVRIGNQPTYSKRNSNAQLYQNTRWSFYQANYQHTDLLIDRGQLQTTLLDRYQDVFATNLMVARRPVQLSDDDYLHVTFTVGSDSTQRRYWWLVLCGASQMGQTLDKDGKLRESIVQTSFFYQPDGRNPSVADWNCFQLFPRDGTPFGLPPDDSRPQSDLRVMINRPNVSSSVVNVSPNQYASVGDTGVANTVYAGWYRQQDRQGILVAPILDDQMVIAPRTRYDLYLSRTRAVLLVNGVQRLCNNFRSQRLTMAQGALGFGQVLYHTAAERDEFGDSFNNRTGQKYYLTNTPYADVRSWDNVGYQEHTRTPSYFDPSVCFSY